MSNLYQIMRQLNSDKSQASSIEETVQSPEKSSSDVTPTIHHCETKEFTNVPVKALYAPLNDVPEMDNNGYGGGVTQMTNGFSHNNNPSDNGGKLSSFLNRHVGTPSRDILVPADTGSVVSELTFDHALRPLAHQVLATLAARQRIQEEVASCESGESSFATPRTRGNATATVSEETSNDPYFHNSFQNSLTEDALPPLYERAHDTDDASVSGMHQPLVTPSPQTSLRNLMLFANNNNRDHSVPSQQQQQQQQQLSGQDGTDESLQYSEQDSVFTSDDQTLFSVSTFGHSVKSRSSLRFSSVETVVEEDDADTPTTELEERASHVITGSSHLPSLPPRPDETDESTVDNIWEEEEKDCATYFSASSCDDVSESYVSTITPGYSASARSAKTRSTGFISTELSIGSDDSNTTNRASNMASSDDSADLCSDDDEEEETCSQSEAETQFTSETQTLATSVLSNEQQDNLAVVVAATEAEVELKTAPNSDQTKSDESLTRATIEPDMEINDTLTSTLAQRTKAIDLASDANPTELKSTQVAASDVVGESPATATKSTSLAVPSEDGKIGLSLHKEVTDTEDGMPPFKATVSKEAAIPVVADEENAPPSQAGETLVGANDKQYVEGAAQVSRATATHRDVDENPHVEQAAPATQVLATQVIADERLFVEQAAPASQASSTQLIADEKPLVEQVAQATATDVIANEKQTVEEAAPASQAAETSVLSAKGGNKTLENTDELQDSTKPLQEESRVKEGLDHNSNENTKGGIERPAENIHAKKRETPPKASRSCCNWKCMLICVGALLVLASVAITAVLVPILVAAHARKNHNRGLRGVTRPSLGQFSQSKLPMAKPLVQTALLKHTTRKSRTSNLRQPK